MKSPGKYVAVFAVCAGFIMNEGVTNGQEVIPSATPDQAAVQQSRGDESVQNSENIQKLDQSARNEKQNEKKVKKVRSSSPDLSKKTGARPPSISRPSGSRMPKGAGKPAGVSRPGRR